MFKSLILLLCCFAFPVILDSTNLLLASSIHKGTTDNGLKTKKDSDTVKIIHVRFDKQMKDCADCFDVCYSKGAYCFEFYDKRTGLEFPCGKGESRDFPDRVGYKQYAEYGDICVCLHDPNHPNVTPFPDCSPQKPCD